MPRKSETQRAREINEQVKALDAFATSDAKTIGYTAQIVALITQYPGQVNERYNVESIAGYALARYRETGCDRDLHVTRAAADMYRTVIIARHSTV